MYRIILIKNTPAVIVGLMILLVSFSSCQKSLSDASPANENSDGSRQGKPNIILILGDDVGYEVPTCDGGQSYSTPGIDNLAANGLRFTQCHACPNCAPSRIELLTGRYGFRNYTQWGHLDINQTTFVNLLHNAGYKTCVAGKWQLDGGDASIKKFGFDKYQVFLPFYTPKENPENKYRYKNPKLYENGAYLPASETQGKYADDMFVDYISGFIDSNLSNPFFIYYPMSLCHFPYCPTPDDPEYAAWNPLVDESDSSFYPSMIKYMDKKVQQVADKINAVGLKNKTLIIYVGDNGTPSQVVSEFGGEEIPGGKTTSTVYGTHVPMIASWPGHITPNTTTAGLMDFSDFFPTMADVAKLNIPKAYKPLDGVSEYPLLFGSTQRLRDWMYFWWYPQNTQYIFKVWAQDENYKLYDTTNAKKFFDIVQDPFEKKSIPKKKLTPDETSRKIVFDSVLKAMHN